MTTNLKSLHNILSSQISSISHIHTHTHSHSTDTYAQTLVHRDNKAIRWELPSFPRQTHPPACISAHELYLPSFPSGRSVPASHATIPWAWSPGPSPVPHSFSCVGYFFNRISHVRTSSFPGLCPAFFPLFTLSPWMISPSVMALNITYALMTNLQRSSSQ